MTNLGDVKSATRRLDSLVRQGKALAEEAWEMNEHDPMGPWPPNPPIDSAGHAGFRAACLHTLTLICGSESVYVRELERESSSVTHDGVLSSVAVLEAVRRDIRLGLLECDAAAESQPTGTLAELHPRVISAADELFKDGHYRQAVLDAFIALVSRVKEVSGVTDQDGKPLMQKVFSAKNPVIRVSEDEGVQAGYMDLFSGAVAAIRNQKAHSLEPKIDAQTCLEWLSFASALFRMLDFWRA